ncbi:MAG: fibrobacter succinogenes major paralogous domain-containing protein [bacterium]
MRYFLALLLVVLISCSESTDVRENIPPVKIGEQIWMLKNLDVERFRNGDIIPQISDSLEWINTESPAWCYYDNSPEIGKIYGRLYNKFAVDDPRGLAPKGWHIPTGSDWAELQEYLGNPDSAAGKLKSIGTIEDGTGLWRSPNTGATNESGFTALPGGYRFPDGWFYGEGMYGYWWAYTGNDTNTWHRFIYYYGAEIHYLDYGTNAGLSVRCIKD